MASSPTAELASFVAQTTYETLPPAVTAMLETLLVDYFRVACVGRRTPWLPKFMQGLSASMGKPQASLLYAANRTDVVRAAQINGVIAYIRELNGKGRAEDQKVPTPPAPAKVN